MIERYSAESNLKSVTLELGGKSPLIIFDDADLETAVACAKVGLFMNAGQVCTACSRIFVQEGIHDKFVSAMVNSVQDINIGSFEQEDEKETLRPIEQGPQVDKIQFTKVLDYIKIGQVEGATLCIGGHRYGHKVDNCLRYATCLLRSIITCIVSHVALSFNLSRDTSSSLPCSQVRDFS